MRRFSCQIKFYLLFFPLFYFVQWFSNGWIINEFEKRKLPKTKENLFLSNFCYSVWFMTVVRFFLFVLVCLEIFGNCKNVCVIEHIFFFELVPGGCLSSKTLKYNTREERSRKVKRDFFFFYWFAYIYGFVCVVDGQLWLPILRKIHRKNSDKSYFEWVITIQFYITINM